MKPLTRPAGRIECTEFKKRRRMLEAKSAVNACENWMAEKLNGTQVKWTRQAQWGKRFFDFWSHELGIAVEVDGPEHRKAYDTYRDSYNYHRSGILVLRVRNFNEEDATAALKAIAESSTWSERRESLGLVGSNRKKVTRVWKASSSIDGFKDNIKTLFD